MNTKKRLIASLLAMAMCFTMLVGSTFAWFTDTASTAVNKIEAGTLDIKLLAAESETAKSLEGETLNFVKAEGHEKETVLFEPGAKYKLTDAWLYNNGNLHAKYQVVITGVDGDEILAQVLDVYVNDTKVGTLAELVATGGVVKTNTIAPKTFDTFGTVALKMQESAGNQYQGKTIEGVAITVQATQAPVEYDSFNNTYDEKAFEEVVYVGTQEDLAKTILEADGPTQIVLTKGTYKIPTIGSAQVPTPKEITITGEKDVVIDMSTAVQTANCSLTFDGVTTTFPATANYTGFQHAAKVVYRNCTINGQQTMYAPEVEFYNCTFVNKANSYNVWTYDATNAKFIDCTFETSGKAVLIYNEVKDGNFVGDYTFDHCTFNDDNAVNTKKGAVETGSNGGNTTTSNKYNIYMNDCTVNGFAENDEGLATGTTFFGNKNSLDKDHLNVVINGTDVY